jgi:alpha-galactosidase
MLGDMPPSMPRLGRTLLAILSWTAIVGSGYAAYAAPAADPLAAAPPMGWNSWDAYGLTIDEDNFEANAVVLAGLRHLGWTYAVIDEGWYMANPSGNKLKTRDYQLDEHGLLVPAINRFPSAARGAGLRPLADWIHERGLKLGIHIVRGIPKQAVRRGLTIAQSNFRATDAADTSDTCPWDDGNYGIRDNAAGQAYYDSMLKLYAEWRIDFIKVDCIAAHPYKASEIRQIATAIQRAGRPMILSLSPGPTELSHAAEVAHYAQMWRISNDIWDGWSFTHSKPTDDFVADGPATIRSTWHELGVTGAQHATRDLLSGKETGPTEAVEVTLQAHGSAVYRLN